MAKHYYISFNGVDFSEIFPDNNPVGTESQLQGTRVWREDVDEIKLTKTSNSSVYDTLHSYFIDKTKFDVEIEIEIYSGTRSSGVLYWKGLFSISDTEDNFQNTVAVLNPFRINDDYRTILEKADMQYELDSLTLILEQVRVGYSEKFNLDTVWTNGSIGTAFSTFNASGGTITQASTGAGVGYEAYVGLGTGVAADDIVILDVSSLTTNTTPTFDIMQGAGSSITDEGAKQITVGLMGFTMSGLSSTPRVWLQAPPGDTTNTSFTARVIRTANDKTQAGELLMTFIENFLDGSSHMDLGAYTGNVVSTFFDNDALPTGAPSSISTFIGANPNGNYVTETSTNEINTTIIGLLIEWFSVTDRPSFKLSFNDIMNQLRDMLQVYWFIDADGKFRIEHEKYFVKLVEDSTPISLDSSAEINAREMKYNKNGVASVEQFSWSQSSNQDFNGRDIVYNNFETTNRAIQYSVNYVTTDIKYIIENIDDASNSGFGIYNCQILTGITGADLYEIIVSTGALSSAEISNAAFSWANIHENYWTWSRMSENATINSVATTMASAVRFLEQGDVRFYYATAIDPYTMINATLTGAAPIEIKRDLETDYVELVLSYDPYKI
jgi:hypothetical protein